ncbi:hypothetical protein SSOG_05747 [Streptomyces himastatinicus ATCC 53653]|uniref:Uncharacterized protein n=1 Tax=Streptomyces himastatinicus ATCC 53653 TaxID=457427 RepID=D9WQ73_9ACTN|nr:hypothetical protein SSOG_05747 [Streptomyces himastatinicus ATCC 53653]
MQAEASLMQIRRYQLEVVPQRLFIRHLRNPFTADGIGNAPQILTGEPVTNNQLVDFSTRGYVRVNPPDNP